MATQRNLETIWYTGGSVALVSAVGGVVGAILLENTNDAALPEYGKSGLSTEPAALLGGAAVSAALSGIALHLGKKATARRAAIKRDLARLDIEHGTTLNP